MHQLTTIASFEDVETVMDKMMQVPVLGILKKQDISCEDDCGKFLDPNIVMDARHSNFKKPDFLIKDQTKTCLTSDELKAMRKAREEHFLQLELRRFEKILQEARPKFHKYKVCKRNVIADSSDDNFWCEALYKTKINNINNNGYHNNYNNNKNKNNNNNNTKHLSKSDKDEQLLENGNIPFSANIKVTIKDKPQTLSDSNEVDNKSLLKEAFRALKANAKENKRLDDLKLQIQKCLANGLLRRCLEGWRDHVQKLKKEALKKKEESEVTHERKIEMFVNAIEKKQEELMRLQKRNKKGGVRSISAPEMPKRSTILVRQVCVVESPAQNRLKAQRKIIEEQKMKLAQQRRMIEEMQIKEFQIETKRFSKETLDTAKEVLDYCGPVAKRTLLQLMKDKGYSDKSLDKPLRVPSPPGFLLRMQARTEARNERVKKAKEAREKKLEEEKRESELAKKRDEQQRRELRLEVKLDKWNISVAQREAKRIRKEQERQKIIKLEREKMLMEKAEEFCKLYLIKRFIFHPLKTLIIMRSNDENKADEHFKKSLLLKSFDAWKEYTRNEMAIKNQKADVFCNENLLKQTFHLLKENVVEERKNVQVACDFADLKLQIKVLNVWRQYAIERIAIVAQKERIAMKHYDKKLLITCLKRWKRYLVIAEELRESELRKEELRALVQKVIPDFDPKLRGISIDD